MSTNDRLIQVSQNDLQSLIIQLENDGWQLICLPHNILDKDSFFNACRNCLPLDPILKSNRSWDALSDSLWEGLNGLNGKKTAILWPNVASMQREHPDDAHIAKSILEDIANSLRDLKIVLQVA